MRFDAGCARRAPLARSAGDPPRPVSPWPSASWPPPQPAAEQRGRRPGSVMRGGGAGAVQGGAGAVRGLSACGGRAGGRAGAFLRAISFSFRSCSFCSASFFLFSFSSWMTEGSLDSSAAPASCTCVRRRLSGPCGNFPFRCAKLSEIFALWRRGWRVMGAHGRWLVWGGARAPQRRGALARRTRGP